MIFWTCTEPAPHLNPLDPESPEYNDRGAIAGTVTKIYPPYLPLPGTEVRLTPGPRLRLADENGEFRFDNLEPGDYQLGLRQQDYAPLSLSLKLSPRQVASPVIRLNGLPRFDSVSVTTSHVVQLPPENDRFFLHVRAQLDDQDGRADISRVWLEIDRPGVVDTLARGENAGEWLKTYTLADLNLASLERLIGRPIILKAVDFPGSVVTSSPVFITRIIQQTQTILTPINNQVADNAPLFRWQLPPAVAFEFSQKIEVSRVDAGFVRRIATIGPFEPTRTSFRFVGRLSEGDYFWTISLIDEFGNSSRSPEAAFRVQ